jgi:hypothetical protein
MPNYTYHCHVCGFWEVQLPMAQLTDERWHDCPGWIGGCLSSLEIIVPAFESLENCGKDMYNPMTGARMEHGYWNHMVNGPRGDGYFHDRAEYKKWMKKENLEEAGPGAVKQIINKVMDQRKLKAL